MIFGMQNPEKIWHKNLTDLSTSPVRCSHFTLGNPKKVIFNSIIQIYFSLFITSQKKTNRNPLAYPIWKCHHTNLWIAKLSSDWRFAAFFQTLEDLKKASYGLSSVALKRTVVMCGNWNVRQAMSHQVFRVTNFCTTCFQSFLTLISRIVHHAVLKFRPCHNKPLPQASTCPYQYTCSSCNMPQMQY